MHGPNYGRGYGSAGNEMVTGADEGEACHGWVVAWRVLSWRWLTRGDERD